MNLSQKIEAYLFYSGEPVTLKKLSSVFGTSQDDTEIALAELDQALEHRGIVLMRNADGLMLATHPGMSDVIQSIRKEELSDPLSKGALETLTLILYRNGATKPEIDFIRGVNSGFMLRNLMIRGLIEKIPNDEDKRITKYRATFDTLRYLGIRDVSELPDFEKFRTEIEKREQSPEHEESVFTTN